MAVAVARLSLTGIYVRWNLERRRYAASSTTRCLDHWFLTYWQITPSLVMGPFYFGNGLFYISVFTRIFLLSINWHGEKGPPSLEDNRQIKTNDYSLSFVPFNLVCNRNKWAFL